MSRKLIDLTGQRFGRLTVIKRVEDYIQPNGHHATMWLCKCECGNHTTVQAGHLKSGYTTSCGCFQKERTSTMFTKNGLFKKNGLINLRLYNIWACMKTRCYNSNDKRYKDYGGRGIKICNEWRDDFQNFYDWSIANGYSEDLTIDRIDNDKGYFPENCRWVDRKTQQRNRRNNRIITINGESHCLSEWCEILNLNYAKVKARLDQCHWSPEKALEIEKDFDVNVVIPNKEALDTIYTVAPIDWDKVYKDE